MTDPQATIEPVAKLIVTTLVLPRALAARIAVDALAAGYRDLGSFVEDHLAAAYAAIDGLDTSPISLAAEPAANGLPA